VPELPEVETVRRGLTPVMEGHRFTRVQLNRPDLRFPFADGFIDRIQGTTLTRLTRRAKFLQAELSSGERLFMHLGMSGRFTIDANPTADFVHAHNTNPKHDHVIFEMSSGARVTFNDPRRFGFMELIGEGEPYRLDDLGPEPMGNGFNAPDLRDKLRGKKSKIKAALLNQRVIAGLGNIYVCEAGSSLKDFANTEGNLGYFQHSFDVYGREGEACGACATPIIRIVQSGRSSFYCRACQK